jgi:Protein of unknown function (DUF2934)
MNKEKGDFTPKAKGESSQPRSARHPTHAEIELRAYQIYVERGMIDADDLANWLQAERELLEAHGKIASGAKATARSGR